MCDIRPRNVAEKVEWGDIMLVLVVVIAILVLLEVWDNKRTPPREKDSGVVLPLGEAAGRGLAQDELAPCVVSFLNALEANLPEVQP